MRWGYAGPWHPRARCDFFGGLRGPIGWCREGRAAAGEARAMAAMARRIVSAGRARNARETGARSQFYSRAVEYRPSRFYWKSILRMLAVTAFAAAAAIVVVMFVFPEARMRTLAGKEFASLAGMIAPNSDSSACLKLSAPSYPIWL